jgi:anti-sigma factor RsiW
MTPENARVLLHAYVDGELDAASTIELESQLRESPALQQEFERLSALQSLVRNRASRFDAPSHLARRVFAALPEAPPARTLKTVPSWWRPLAMGATMAAVALLLWSVVPTFNRLDPDTGTREEVLAAHVRSLMADHLTDLTSTERHTVKPWLSSRLDFAPPVEDLASEGFTLIGGRLDYLGGRPVAALVYRYRQHIINVFVWPSSNNQQVSVQTWALRGYNIARFDSRGMSFWAVSDLNPEDLQKLASLLQRGPQ